MNKKIPAKYTNNIELVIFCLAVNLLFSKLVLLAGLPIYLDSIGTILSAALGGMVPAIIVGVLTNAANAIGDPVTLYYAIVSMLIAISAGLFVRKRVYTSLKKSLLVSLIFAAIGGVLGSLMTWAMSGLEMGSGVSAAFASYLNTNTSFGPFLSQLTADTVIDIVDKILTVIIVFIILKLLPEKLLKSCKFGYIYKSGALSEFSDCNIKKAPHKFSLKTKIAIIIMISSFVLSCIAVSIGYTEYSKATTDKYLDICNNISTLMAASLNGDTLAAYSKSGKEDDKYTDIKNMLIKFRSCFPQVEYMYVYHIEKDGCHVLFDLDTKDVKGARLGEVIPFDESFTSFLPELFAGENIDPVVENGQYGWLMTDYAPIYDSHGSCIAYAAVDISMRSIIADRYKFLIRMVSLLFCSTVVIVILAIYYSGRKIVAPIDDLADSASRFAYDSEGDRNENIELLRRLNIKTGDEIENLYDAISKTTGDVAQYIRLIDEKTYVISKLQDNLIVSFADMVENRDANTGSHINRTAAYVRDITKALVDRGIYRDQLRESDIELFEKSAPLHDIGKIHIPDAILNKPGRLTPEEFEIIKTHTTVGREILEDVLNGIDGDYLSEAVNMAAYHHERWDGKGYMDGLSGESIPLSARIMAVADVFDALISKRSYKEPYPLDTAFLIIEQGAGSQFDPLIVGVFLDIKGEIAAGTTD